MEDPLVMEEQYNGTIDPACLQEPPLAHDVIKRKWAHVIIPYLLIKCPYQPVSANRAEFCPAEVCESESLSLNKLNSVSTLLLTEMDVFGLILYSMLTFMSSTSLLLYLEQSVFIYKKLSYPKKTTIIWISGAAPVSIRASSGVMIVKSR